MRTPPAVRLKRTGSAGAVLVPPTMWPAVKYGRSWNRARARMREDSRLKATHTLSQRDLAGAEPVEAAELSNQAAGVVVGKLGTATVTQAEIRNTIARAIQEAKEAKEGLSS